MSRSAVTPNAEGLAEGLHSRHVRMIAVGGAIGVGLFLGSGAGIALAGPSLILAYAVVGAFIFIIMRALGELLLYRPVAGSFAEYAREFLGPAFGFVTGWGYWITWSLIGMTELTAVSLFMRFWFPDLPQWVTVLTALVLLVLLNLARVGVFGEAEFWFASIKVVTIIGLIVIGLVVTVFHVGPAGQSAGFENLFALAVPGTEGGFFPYGVTGFLIGMQIAVFSYQGAELLGMAAAETQNRRTVLPKAINSVPFRIAIFYVGSLGVLMAVVHWTEFSGDTSPFVQALDRVGIPAAASIMNFVVITSALSSCSSGALYSNARLLMKMSRDGIAPRRFGRVNRSHVPANGVFASAAVMLAAVVLNLIVPAQAFSFLLAICTLAALWTWGVIIVSLLAYRRRLARGEAGPSKFPLPGGRWLAWLTLAFLAGIVVIMAFDENSRPALLAAPLWAAILVGGYFLSKRFNPRHAMYVALSDMAVERGALSNDTFAVEVPAQGADVPAPAEQPEPAEEPARES